MNGIDRRGQKVVCVEDIEITLRDGSILLHGPKQGQVYTVTDFVDNEGVVRAENFVADLDPAIVLAELPPLRSRKTGKPAGWPIAFFRPVDDRKTDIGALRGLLAPAPQLEDA